MAIEVSDHEKIVRVLDRANRARRRGFGLFGGLSWWLVVQIVLEIVIRLLRKEGYSTPYQAVAKLPEDLQAEVDREYPR